MWKLKIAEGEPWLKSENNHVGRQCWEFDHNAGTPQELAQVEQAREQFKKNRFHRKQSSDLLMRMQVYIYIVMICVSKICTQILHTMTCHCFLKP